MSWQFVFSLHDHYFSRPINIVISIRSDCRGSTIFKVGETSLKISLGFGLNTFANLFLYQVVQLVHIPYFL